MTLAETWSRCRMRFTAVVLLLAGCYGSVVASMVGQWWQDGNYSHCFLVPVIAAWFVYERRERLSAATVVPWNPGLAVIVLGLAQLAVGLLACEQFTARSSLIVLLAGLVLFFLGLGIFRLLLVPLCYCLLAVPLPYLVYDAAAFPLKLFVTGASVRFLKLIGVAVLSEGNIIMFPAITLEVADACSGMRSLASLLALAVAVALIVDTRTLGRWLIVLSAVPIAVLTNAMRVIVTGILAQQFGEIAAQGFFHEFAGLVVFAAAMILLMAVAALVRWVCGDDGAHQPVVGGEP